jgi:hypothetical protein
MFVAAWMHAWKLTKTSERLVQFTRNPTGILVSAGTARTTTLNSNVGEYK